MIKRYLPEIVAALIFIPMLFVHSCANTTQSPTGGDKDTIPPLIIGIDPLPGPVNVPARRPASSSVSTNTSRSRT